MLPEGREGPEPSGGFVALPIARFGPRRWFGIRVPAGIATGHTSDYAFKLFIAAHLECRYEERPLHADLGRIPPAVRLRHCSRCTTRRRAVS